MSNKKTSNVSDKVISLGKTIIEFAKQCDYVYSETSNIYTYGLDIVARQFILGDKYASIFSLNQVGKHNWEISYWKSYKDEDVSYHYFKDNEIELLYPCHCVSLLAKIKMGKKLDIKEVGVGLEIII